MVYDKIHSVFRKMPPALRRGLTLIPIEYRLGGSDFKETYEFLADSERWSRERLVRYQKNELKRTLQHAVETVPYYRDIELDREDPVKNLKKFPIVDKETIRDNPDQFTSETVDKRSTYDVTTGGTSGKPFSFSLDNSTYGEEWAFIMTGWKRTGYTPGDRMVTFKGLEYDRSSEGIYWNYNPLYNTYELSPFHLTPENLGEYVTKIREIDPDYIHGYPSAITKLAKYVDEGATEFPKIDCVFAASENLYEAQREVISNAFDTRVFSHYGQSEKVALAAECDESTKYHLYPQYGYTELLDGENDDVSVGERGEIVATGFLNKCMPFIRYRTGDYAVKGEVGACSCGRAYRVLESIRGRAEKERTVHVDETNTVPIHALYYTMHGDALDGVSSIQFKQDRPGDLTVSVVPQGNPNAVDTGTIRDAIEGKTSPDFGVDVRIVDEVELTESGKRKLLLKE